VFSSDLLGVNPATLNGMIFYYRLMTKLSGLGDSTELSRMGLSQQPLQQEEEPRQSPLQKGNHVRKPLSKDEIFNCIIEIELE
jgi:hypothetical protein